MMVGLAAILGAVLTLRVVRRDGEDAAVQARALLLAYAAALAGGFVFEGLRALPVAIALGYAGARRARGPRGVRRAARGARRARALPPPSRLGARVLRPRRHPDGPLVRLRPRRLLPRGVRLRAPHRAARGASGSRRAASPRTRTRRPVGCPRAPSACRSTRRSSTSRCSASPPLALALPVLLRRPERDGRAFAVWITVYAAGRFALEVLRADADRGVYAGLSSAQYVSLAPAPRRRRRRDPAMARARRGDRRRDARRPGARAPRGRRQAARRRGRRDRRPHA